MNLTITQVKPMNHVNKEVKNNEQNKDASFSLVFDDKKISEEEDKKLYELYKRIYEGNEKGVLRATGGETFEQFKAGFSLFPDSNSPGTVRRAWRERLEKCTTIEEHIKLAFFSATCDYILKNRKVNMINDLNGYLKFIEEIRDYYEEGRNVPGMDSKHCDDMINIANSFETDLKKYM